MTLQCLFSAASGSAPGVEYGRGIPCCAAKPYPGDDASDGEFGVRQDERPDGRGTCARSRVDSLADSGDISCRIDFDPEMFREADCQHCGGLADDAQPCRFCGLGMWGGR